MIATRCAICDTDDSQEVYPARFEPSAVDDATFSARRMPDTIHYRIVRCRRCGLLYSNPILPPEKIETLYRRSRITYKELIQNLSMTYGKYLQKVDALVPSKERLLEIGCGNGYFLTHAKTLGYKEVWGVEPSRSAVAMAPPGLRPYIIADVFRPRLFRANFFDGICTFQTLDHLVDPNTALIESYRILKKRGVIVAIVHDASSWTAKLLGERSPMIDIEHIYLFNTSTLPRLFQKNRFEVLDVFPVNNLHTLKYWVHLSPIPRRIKNRLLALLHYCRIDALPLWLKAGNIGIVARKSP